MNSLDYGVIGNCRTAALVSKNGSIDWFCLPDFDSPSVFAKLLDNKKGGSFHFEVSSDYQISQTYLGDTNILYTRFERDTDIFVVYDYMPRYKTDDNKYYMPPEIHRYIRVLKGAPQVKIHYHPQMNYAKEEVHHEIVGNYIKSHSLFNTEDKIYLYSNIESEKILDKDNFVTLSDRDFFLLSYNQKLVAVDFNRILMDYERTKVYWLNWINRSREFTEYNQMVKRSLLVLKLMSYQYSGAMLAAITTSLPESIGETRNWDYRFCWLRDASMSVDTLLFMKHQNTTERFIRFVKQILKSRHDKIQIMYGIRGERQLEEEILDHLAGYENSYPVRIGNAAYYQEQNDSVGYLLDIIYKYYLYFPGTLDEVEEIWELIKNIVRQVYSAWRQPDRSIWEFRTREHNFVFSKVMSWVALDRASLIAELLHKDFYAERWRSEADVIKAEVHEKGWNEKLQSFTQAYENDDLDSSVLLMQFYGFIDPKEERYVKTVHAIKENLFYEGLMYRYKAADDFGIPTSSFTICTFWLIDALHAIGETEEAQGLFEQMITYSNHVGLFSEDLDFKTKRQLGNFPQAYSHLAFINTASLFSAEKIRSRFIRP